MTDENFIHELGPPHPDGINGVEQELSDSGPEIITEVPSHDDLRPFRDAREREATLERQRLASIREQAAAQFKTKMRRIGGSVVSVVAISGAAVFGVVPGGGWDMLQNYRTSAGSVAAEALAAQQDSKPSDIEQQAANQRVVELYDELDQKGNDQIVQDVNEWKAAHQELYRSSSETESAISKIKSSRSNDEVIATLSEFMKFNNIAVDYGSDQAVTNKFDTHQEECKRLALAYIAFFSRLPSDFVSQASISQITISEYNFHENDQEARGLFTHNRTIQVAAVDAFDAELEKQADPLSFDDYMETIGHEFGHAFDGSLTNVKVDPNAQSREWNIITQSPDLVSDYSIHEGKRSAYPELGAELTSAAMTHRDGELVPPSDAREFASEANGMIMAQLGAFEMLYPGIAKIIVANRYDDLDRFKIK